MQPMEVEAKPKRPWPWRLETAVTAGSLDMDNSDEFVGMLDIWRSIEGRRPAPQKSLQRVLSHVLDMWIH